MSTWTPLCACSSKAIKPNSATPIGLTQCSRPMAVLNFFTVRLKTSHKRKAELYLRYQALADGKHVTDNEDVLSSFCFPLGPESVVAKEFMASEDYMFTLTQSDGRRFQGFCRGFLPPAPKVGPRQRFPQVMCLVTNDTWCNFYFKVLQVLEQLVKSADGLLDSDLKDLPETSHTAAFLTKLGSQLSTEPKPGQLLRLQLPKAGHLTVSPPRLIGGAGGALLWGEDQLELQVPPDCGNGSWNCGIPLARLLWHVPMSAMMTLIASMLMERRIILVSQARDTVTAAVQAAAALLYPFKWHHIFLPMLPRSFKEYLAAPMPFLIGMPAQMLPLINGIPIDEVTLIDLDMGKCNPAPGSSRDDASMLPYRDQLEAALQAVHKNIRSPTEYETSPMIAGIMQQFFLKLFGRYHQFVHEDTPEANQQWAALLAASPAPPTFGAGGGAGNHTSPRPLAAGALGPAAGRAGRRDGGDPIGALRASAMQKESLTGHGLVFEHVAFVNTHRRNEKAHAFLTAFRGSQMYEMFMQERLALMAGGASQPSRHDPFEDRIVR
ncbi:AEX-3 domain-containing protein [Haematococcus lacustris]